MERSKTNISDETKTAYLFNAPLIIVAVVFVLVPVIGTIVTSLMRDVTFLPEKFLAVENYQRLFSDRHFYESLQFTLLFVVVSVSFELVFGLAFALLLNETLPFRGFLRVVILIPWVIPIAISARVWELIYNFNYGIFNYIILQLGISDQPVSWLGSSVGAFIAVVISDVWKTTPFMAIILLTGLSAINSDLYKQAKVDGTNFLQRFFMITLPLLKPVLIVALLFRSIDAIRIFDLIYVLTGGGPGGSTSSLSIYAFNYYVSGDFGYGSAVSVIVFLAAGLLSVLYIKFGKFRETLQ
ncbi:sugar ABC transporter permease [bacterium BMS3Abin03]|jgi:multiple sugar transport system permease protein|nr:sugar ABC transporter permease [bacterium BMS3Abin03]MCG6958268.1 sugar ABC transporter permease [bacterium BMS3Abin03]